MNIFVAKLSSRTDSEDLRLLFEQYGEVRYARVIFDRETSESKCYGFVEMDDDDQAREAVEKLDGFEVHGRVIVVKEAKPREER